MDVGEPRLGRVLVLASAIGFTVITGLVALLGVACGLGAGSALGLGVFVGAFGGAGLGATLGAGVAFTRHR